METKRSQTQTNLIEDAYWKIWQTEQDNGKTRWNNFTFFTSVSFAIFGFSFQSHLDFSAVLNFTHF